MTDKEAMKLALDALDIAQGLLADARSYHQPKMLAAYTAIKQALAQPEIECNPQDLCAGCRCRYAHVQPEQEPVQEPDLTEQGRTRSAIIGNNVEAMMDAGLPFLKALETTLKVYDHSTPPAQPPQRTEQELKENKHEN